MTKKELEDENTTLRWAVNPNTLERMINDGEIEVGIGIPHWSYMDKHDPAEKIGVDRLVRNVRNGNTKPSKRFKKWLDQYYMLKKFEQ